MPLYILYSQLDFIGMAVITAEKSQGLKKNRKKIYLSILNSIYESQCFGEEAVDFLLWHIKFSPPQKTEVHFQQQTNCPLQNLFWYSRIFNLSLFFFCQKTLYLMGRWLILGINATGDESAAEGGEDCSSNLLEKSKISFEIQGKGGKHGFI